MTKPLAVAKSMPVKSLVSLVHAGLTKQNQIIGSTFLTDRLQEAVLAYKDFADWQLNNSSLDHEFNVEIGPCDQISLDQGVEIEAETAWGHPKQDLRGKLAICYGAGIDSTVAVYHALELLKYQPMDIVLVQVDYGAPYAAKERACAEALYDDLRPLVGSLVHVKLNPLLEINEQNMGKGYIIPARNAMLAAIGALFGSTVWIVANYRKIDDEPGSAVDKNRRFYGECSQLLSLMYGRPINVMSPFLHLSKAQTMIWFKQMYSKVDMIEMQGMEVVKTHTIDMATQVLDKTTTCYHPTEHRCGECFACCKLAMALINSSMTLPSFDMSKVEKTPLFLTYLERELKKGRQLPARWLELLRDKS